MSSCGDGFLIEPTTRDHPLSHDPYSDLDKGLDLDHPLKAVELDHPLQDHDRDDESDSTETCRGADTATCG
jgi:hypothetical protein